MSKIDEVKALLRNPGFASNSAIAATVGCDEGLVRKARPLVRVELLEEKIARLDEKLGAEEKEIESLYDFIDKIDAEIASALEAVGKLPGKPAGFPDRVDVIASLVVESHKELAQYRRANRPRPKKHDDSVPLPLWEKIGPGGEIVPFVTILEMHA